MGTLPCSQNFLQLDGSFHSMMMTGICLKHLNYLTLALSKKWLVGFQQLSLIDVSLETSHNVYCMLLLICAFSIWLPHMYM